MCSDGLFLIKIIGLCVLVINSNCSHHTDANHTRITPQGHNNRCVLPSHPKFGRWVIYEATSYLFPGEFVPSRTVLELKCQESYKLSGLDMATCIRGKWKPQIGKCLRTCPTISSTSVVTVTCSFDGKMLDSCADPFDGTVARFYCAFNYEAQERDAVRLCSNGNWIGNLPVCVPTCGKPSAENDPRLIVGGTKAQRGEYPWQVALYNKINKVLLCSGTLLNQRVIVTAAHCITDVEGKLQPKDLFVVAVGNYFREYNHPDDSNTTQFSRIYKMYIPRQYKAAAQHYFGDVGIIVTTKIFNLSNSVLPICIMWESRRHQALTDPARTKHAYISGWGYTVEYKKPSDVLKRLKVPLITDEKCSRRLSEDEVKYLTDDKLCAGFLNSSTSVCKGDSGGGLVAKFGKRYYIIGIVSIAPQKNSAEGGCDTQKYTLYTRFSYYIEKFILKKEARFRPRLDCPDGFNCHNEIPVTTPRTTTQVVTESSRGHCTLPNHPKFGKWSVTGVNDALQPGMSVASGTVALIECNAGYKHDSYNIIFCHNDQWSSDIGRCLKTCSPRVSTATMQVKCSYHGKETENCTDAVDGTIAKFRCIPFYEDLQLMRRPVHICSNGVWDQPLPHCVPVCGQRPPRHISFIPEETAEGANYPWHISIHNVLDKQQVICSGSLLSQKIVLTAATCITYQGGNLKNKTNYVISAGKMFNDFNDARDSQAQFSNIDEIFLPQEYKGHIQNYVGDIAILSLKEAFVISRNVLPVCLDVAQNYKPPENGYGFVSSWGVIDPNSSTALEEWETVLVSQSECNDEVPAGFENYLTYDKICARSVINGTGCKPDSGAALVTKYDDRYYITGLASLSPASPSSVGLETHCNQMVLYTNVSKYINSFILKILAAYKI